MFGENIVGKRFVRCGRAFTVKSVDLYPAEKVSRQHVEILSIPAGNLVAVPYRGTLIPNITLGRTGVVRLIEIEMGGKTYNRPSTISEALGINQPYRAYTFDWN